MNGFFFSAPIADAIAFVLTLALTGKEYRDLFHDEASAKASLALVEQAGGQR
jgi:hypothetical protein